MNKIAIVGSAGAGKSTLARRLGAVLNLPVVHLDVLFWQPGWVETARDDWAAVQRELVAGERWILDGNYGGTIDIRLGAADTVVFLDLPRSVCLWRVLKRRVQYARRQRPDLPPGCPESIDVPFLQWVWSYPHKRRPQMLARLAQLPGSVTVVVLRSQHEVQHWLDGIAMQPTPYPDVNLLLAELLSSVQAILGRGFVGIYLDGSLTSGAFDGDSDIDFVVVSEDEVSGELFPVLQAMHDRIATLDTPWAIQLEGSYLSRRALRRYDPANALHANIERGLGERLKMVQHDAAWMVHLAIVREQGITLAGPEPKSLIDPVSPGDLRRAMVSMLPGWAGSILDEPERIASRGYQSYVVLSLCRALYTLQHGTVVSKPAAARWAQQALGAPWALLIERAWDGRHTPDRAASPEDVDATLAFIRFTIERGHE